MKQQLYYILYNRHINFLIRNILKPFQQLLPSFLKIPPSGIIRIKPDNTLIKIATNQTNFVTHLIFWKGYNQFEYTDIFCELVKKITCFYDIGANIGYYSLLAASINPDIKVVAFEPAEGPLYYLKKNIEINKLNNICFEPLAISGKTGEVEFIHYKNQKYKYLKYSLGGEGHVAENSISRNIKMERVRSISLDKYIIDTAVNNIDLIKIDTEGSEDIILKNSYDILRNMKPIIICETLFNRIEHAIEEAVSPHGYLFFNHYPAGLKKVDTIIRTYDDGVRNCFLVHPSKVHLINDYIARN